MDRASGGTKSILLGNIKVSVLVGNLARQKTDVLVCSTVSSLLLKDGRASNALLEAGGNSLQDECSKKYPNGLLGGDIAEVGPGNLDCKIVYFVSIPMMEHRDTSSQEFEIRQITNECLKKAGNDNWKSVTFPALGTGRTGYQQDIVASAIYKSIEDFSRRYPSSSLTVFDIVIHKSDKNTFQTFEFVMESKAAGQGRMSSGQINSNSLFKSVFIQYGKLADWTADILVCICNHSMDLNKSSLGRSLLQNGGPMFQNKCMSLHPVDGVAAVKGNHQLKCKYVYVGMCRPYNQGSVQEMSSFITSCLELANKHKMKSIAFPALGTGGLGYPLEESANLFKKSLKQFLKQNPDTTLQAIFVVIYDCDRHRESVMQAYKDELDGKNVFQKGIELVKNLFNGESEGQSRPNRPSSHSSSHHKSRGYRAREKPASETLPKIELADLHFSKKDEIGRGGFGVVYKGKWIGTDVAIKGMKLKGNYVEVMKIVEQEIKVHSRLRHPHIVQIMGVCTDHTYFYIISEFIDGSDLYGLIFEYGRSKLNTKDKLIYAKQCCQAVAYLHGVKPPIIHQDIKPSNVLISRVTRQVKLCDFGIAKIRSFSTKPTTEGTPYYMAPELLIGGKSSSFASDIWALGCTFLDLFTEVDLWAPDGSFVTEQDIMAKMIKNKPPPAFAHLGSRVPYNVRKIITDCIEYDQSKRPTAMMLVDEFDKNP